MQLGDYIAIGVVAIIVAAAVTFIVRQKKKGVKCIGCPHSCKCSSGGCGCNHKNKI